MPTERHADSRRRLENILGLPESASDTELRQAAGRLLSALRRRRNRANASATSEPGLGSKSGSGSNEALANEIEELTARVERFAGLGTPGIARASRVDRTSLAGALLGSAFMLAILVAYASGIRIVWPERDVSTAELEEPARLIILGRLSGATLRVLDAERDELLVKTPAQAAIVELATGRYALEVSREDCPDRWTRSVYFEAGTTHRFEPSLCAGEGKLTIRSNVRGDRLMIDGFDVGATGANAHTLGVGDHEIRIEKTGYVPYESRIRIKPDIDLQVRAELRTEENKGHGLRPKLPVAFETPSLTASSLPRPEPFDLGNLQEKLAPRKSGIAPTRLLSRAGSAGLPDGGSTAWHDRVSRELLTRFDGDDSGLIDRLEESDSISCPLWKEIERDFDRGGLGLSMARYFGFDGTEWHRDALGFARRMRSAAYAKMKECGLQT